MEKNVKTTKNFFKIVAESILDALGKYFPQVKDPRVIKAGPFLMVAIFATIVTLIPGLSGLFLKALWVCVDILMRIGVFALIAMLLYKSGMFLLTCAKKAQETEKTQEAPVTPSSQPTHSNE